MTDLVQHQTAIQPLTVIRLARLEPQRLGLRVSFPSRVLGGVWLGLAAWMSPHAAENPPVRASGYVYIDRNANGVRDRGERGLAGVRVSNQRDFTRTDRYGRWQLPLLEDGETTFFVVKPRGYAPPLSEDRLPRFSYTYKPAGSPPLKFHALAPSGPLPDSIDFALNSQAEPGQFQALFFGDTQPRDLTEVNYFKHDIVEELIGQTRARFGVTLGDIAFDDLDVLGPLNATVALIGIPWWNVIGNHDVNLDAPSLGDFDDTYNRVYGPSYFSFTGIPQKLIGHDISLGFRWKTCICGQTTF